MALIEEFSGDNDNDLFEVQQVHYLNLQKVILYECSERYINACKLLDMNELFYIHLQNITSFHTPVIEPIADFIAAYFRYKESQEPSSLFNSDKPEKAWIDYIRKEAKRLAKDHSFCKAVVKLYIMQHYHDDNESIEYNVHNYYEYTYHVLIILREQYSDFPKNNYRFGERLYKLTRLYNGHE